ncbi:MAG: response regulator [Sinobacteraceae bacterium]|nr:response regulator [Nevskiaceae bacterium]
MTESSEQVVELSGKRALIVDDSKSARAFLARMLEKHGLEVDTAETAEQAIVYLARTRPDVIFMDHLMPGMDGFQAVQSIKNNPRTATIPIMMFTSQEGELYLGQARALGALGVLPKQVKPTEVSTVLHQLRLVPDRRKPRLTAFEPGNAVAQEAFQRSAATMSIVGGAGNSTGSSTGGGSDAATPAQPSGEPPMTPAQLRALVEDVVRDQVSDLRRSVSSLLDEQMERVLGELREGFAGTATVVNADPVGEALFDSHEPAPRRSRAPWLIAVGASVLAAVLGALWWREAETGRSLAAQLAESREVQAARPVAISQGPEAGATGLAAGSAAAPAVVGSESVQPVPYGEVPISGERFEMLRHLLDDLAERGFRGLVSVTSYPGRYCLAGSATDGFGLVEADAPLSKCEVLGNPFDEQLSLAQREPLALANLVGTIRQRSGGAIEVQLVNGTETQRVAAYPDPATLATAGEWNRAATANNRLEIRVRPQTP